MIQIEKLPNYLTMLRIFVIPLIVLAFYIPNTTVSAALAFVLFLIAGISDFFDGYIARKFDCASKFGELMDPIADKLVVITVLVILSASGDADFIPVLIIILREILVSGYREFIYANQGEMPVTKLAKWKTTMQFVAVTLLLFYPVVGAAEIQNIGQILLWLAAVLTFITGYQYTIHTLSFVREVNEPKKKKGKKK